MALAGSGHTVVGRVVVGRDAEIGCGTSAVDRLVGEGRGGAVLVSGAPGVGKTTVAEVVADHARERGLDVVRGVCSVLERDVPFALWARALRLRPSSDDPARAALGEALHGGAAEGLAKLRILDGISELVEEAAIADPVVLFLDDLQWADEASLAALERVAELAAQLPVLLLATARPFPEPPAAWHWQRHLDPGGHLERIDLQPLDEAAVHDFATAVLGDQVDSELVDRLAAAGGNPLFVTELLRAADAGGDREDGGALPPSVRRSVLRHLEFLDDAVLDLLREAAALGTRFDLDLLATTSGLGADEVVERLAPARASELLVHDEDGLRFAHDLVRDAVHEDEVPELRARRHAEIVNALHAAGHDPSAWAGHLDLADLSQLNDAGARFHEAGRAASHTHLPTARRLLRRALDLTPPPAGEVLVDLAEVEWLLDPYEDPDSLELRTLHRTVAPLLAPGVPQTLSVEVVDRLANPDDMGPLHDLDDEEFDRAWDELVAAGMSPAMQAMRPVHDLLRDHWRQVRTAAAEGVRGLVPVDADALRDVVEELLETAEDVGEATAFLHLLRASVRWEADGDALARHELALRDHVNARAALPRDRGVSPLAMEIDRSHAFMARVVQQLGGQAPPSEPIFADLADRYRRMGCTIEAQIHDDHRIASLSTEPLKHLDLLEEHAHDLSRRAARGELHAKDNHQYIWAHRWHLGRGRFEEAAVLAERHPDNIPKALHADAVDDGETARHWVRDVFRTRGGSTDICFIAARRGIAQEIPPRWQQGSPVAAAIAGGDLDALLGLLESGELRPRPWLSGRDRREEVAYMLIAADRGDEAVPLLEAALEDAQALGEEHVERRLLWQLRELGVKRRTRAGRATVDHGWEAITPTEWRVLDLVEQGLVYREVGERLFVSRRTVESHVANVFRKLGTNSRRDLTSMLREGEGADRLAEARAG